LHDHWFSRSKSLSRGHAAITATITATATTATTATIATIATTLFKRQLPDRTLQMGIFWTDVDEMRHKEKGP